MPENAHHHCNTLEPKAKQPQEKNPEESIPLVVIGNREDVEQAMVFLQLRLKCMTEIDHLEQESRDLAKQLKFVLSRTGLFVYLFVEV